MIYRVTGSIGSAMRSYLEAAFATYGNPGAPKPGRSKVPAGISGAHAARCPRPAGLGRATGESRLLERALARRSPFVVGGPRDLRRYLSAFVKQLG